MDKRTKELRQIMMDAESAHMDAYRRAVWMERHLYDAATESEFNTRLASLKQQEQLLQQLGRAAMVARVNYMSAEARGALA